MNLKKEAPSKNVKRPEQYTNYEGRGNRVDKAGKGDRLYNSPEYKSALKEISTDFQNKARGKTDRERKALTLEEITNIFRKK